MSQRQECSQSQSVKKREFRRTRSLWIVLLVRGPFLCVVPLAVRLGFPPGGLLGTAPVDRWVVTLVLAPVLPVWTVFCRNWARRRLERRRQRTQDANLTRTKRFETWLGFRAVFAEWSFLPVSMALLVGVLYGQVLPLLVTSLIYAGLMAMYFPKRKEIENLTP